MHAGTRSTNLQLTCPAKAFNFYVDGTSTTTHIGTLRGLSDPAEDGTIFETSVTIYQLKQRNTRHYPNLG